MGIFLAGDTHGVHDHIIAELQADSEAFCIHLGDFELQAPAEDVFPSDVIERLYWIPGNHDFDSEEAWSNLYRPSMIDRCLHARVMTIDGIHVAGLGGNFQGKVWMPPAEPEHRSRAALAKLTPRHVRHSKLNVPRKRAGAI